MIVAPVGQLAYEVSGPIAALDVVVAAAVAGPVLGRSVSVSPSVVRTLGDVTVGKTTVSEPIIMMPGSEVKDWPSGNVETSIAGDEVEEMVLAGCKVSVSPSVVKTLAEVTDGKITVSEPIIMTPDCEVNDWPSGNVEVSPTGAEVKDPGESVKVSPSVVSTLSEVTDGRVTVSEPIMIIPDCEVKG